MFDATPEEYDPGLVEVFAEQIRAQLEAAPYSPEQFARLRILRSLASDRPAEDRPARHFARLVSALRRCVFRVDSNVEHPGGLLE
jgi:hypothetical protein